MIFSQLLCIILGISTLYFCFFYIIKADDESFLSRRRDHIKFYLNPLQEEWRAWKFMNMEVPLKKSLVSFKDLHQLETLELVPKSRVRFPLDSDELIIPENTENTLDYVVYAQINSKRTFQLRTVHVKLLVLLFGFFLLFLYQIVYIFRFVRSNFYRPIFDLNEAFLKLEYGKHFETNQIVSKGEVQDLIKNIMQLYNDKIVAEQYAFVAQAQIAAQVAHDIRSPLAALSMQIGNMSAKIHEAERISLRSSLKRIHDIVNNLSQMKERKVESKMIEKRHEHMHIELLSSLTESIISEKRTQYRDRQGIVIDEQFDESSYGAFASVESVEFKRVISNVINNAVEALGDAGSVTLNVSATPTDITLKITDTGKGIPKDNLHKVFDRGISFGKKHGSGLGLAHAKETMEKWNGNITIESEVGVGTTVILIFKRAESPNWFLPRIMVKPQTKIVVLDDDQSIHDIWKTRFRDYDLADGDIELHHFTTSQSFSSWYDQHRFSQCLILSDYELLGESVNGLDVIEKYGRGQDSILVTSHCEEEKIQKRCESLGTRLLPKGLAYCVPIEVHLREVYDAIFIGHDNMLLLHWKLSARECNKRLYCYYAFRDFLYDAKIIDRRVPVYIGEKYIQDNSCESFSKTIKDYGFSRVYMTAEDPAKSPPLPWISGITGKNPPWLESKMEIQLQ